jgi:hypothetical protein
MTEPTQEQIADFWHYFGFLQEVKQFDGDRYSSDKHWVLYGKGYDSYKLPEIDLNNLFKWAVPKLYKQYINSIEVEILPPVASSPNLWVVRITTQRKDLSQASANDPALALFWAIYQVIQETK